MKVVDTNHPGNVEIWMIAAKSVTSPRHTRLCYSNIVFVTYLLMGFPIIPEL